MSTLLELKPPVDAALDEHLARDATEVSDQEQVVEAQAAMVVAGLAALLVIGFGIPHDASVLRVAASALVLAVAMRMRFDVPGGFTVPTQLGFVPLVLAGPGALLPLVTVVAVAAGELPSVLRGTRRPARLVLSTVPNCAFALGPALVLCLQGAASWPVVALLLASTAAQLTADLAMSSWREWRLTGATPSDQLRDAAPVVLVDLALTPVGAAVGVAGGVWALALLPLLLLLSRFSVERRSRLEGLSELNAAYRGTALVLGDVIEADDGYTGAHSQGVVDLAMDVGRQLALDVTAMRDLEFGALLHDVGKVAISKAIINKPGPLDDEEWVLMRTHTIRGQEMLDRVGGFMREVGWIVRSHHERWDGAGYPDGLAGEDIPLASRIIACCDTYDAMTTDRPYRRALGRDVAEGELRAQAGRQFDPRVVEAAIGALARRASSSA